MRLEEARRPGIVAPAVVVRDLDVPQIAQAAGLDHLDETHALFEIEALGAVQGVDGIASANRAIGADALFQGVEKLEPETRPILERAAVFVGAVIELLDQELERQVGIRADELDIIETRLTRALGGLDMKPDDVLDVVVVHLVGIVLGVVAVGVFARATLGSKGFEALGVAAAVPELDAGETVMAVDQVAHGAQVDDVAVVPQAGAGVGRIVRIGADRTIFGAGDGPTALDLHGPEVSLGADAVGARVVAMGHAEKTVPCGFRADLDGLEQAIVFGVTCHGSSPLH